MPDLYLDSSMIDIPSCSTLQEPSSVPNITFSPPPTSPITRAKSKRGRKSKKTKLDECNASPVTSPVRASQESENVFNDNYANAITTKRCLDFDDNSSSSNRSISNSCSNDTSFVSSSEKKPHDCKKQFQQQEQQQNLLLKKRSYNRKKKHVTFWKLCTISSGNFDFKRLTERQQISVATRKSEKGEGANLLEISPFILDKVDPLLSSSAKHSRPAPFDDDVDGVEDEKEWTEAETTRFIELYEMAEKPIRRWAKFAKNMEGRTNKECKIFFKRLVDEGRIVLVSTAIVQPPYNDTVEQIKENVMLEVPSQPSLPESVGNEAPHSPKNEIAEIIEKEIQESPVLLGNIGELESEIDNDGPLEEVFQPRPMSLTAARATRFVDYFPLPKIIAKTTKSEHGPPAIKPVFRRNSPGPSLVEIVHKQDIPKFNRVKKMPWILSDETFSFLRSKISMPIRSSQPILKNMLSSFNNRWIHLTHLYENRINRSIDSSGELNNEELLRELRLISNEFMQQAQYLSSEQENTIQTFQLI